MNKKICTILMIATLALAMIASAFAEGIPHSKTELQQGQALIGNSSGLNEASIDLGGEQNAYNLFDNANRIQSSSIKLTGKAIQLAPSKRLSSTNTLADGPQRSGQAISAKYGILTGTLSSTNTWDYYVFSSATDFYSISKLVTDNANYTMTLGVVDYEKGTINLTNYVTAANTPFFASFQAGTYAWVIQSSNATYGNNYALQYNMSDPITSKIVYASGDLQKVYAIDNQKLTINNQVQNIDYKLDLEWEIPPVGAGELRWNKLHVWMENANVDAVHVGGCKYYASSQLYQYPHTIVLAVKEGGLFTHKFSQNPPYIDLGNKDMAGEVTPRAINSTDVNSRGGHYLIYNIDTGTVVEFASGLTKPWSNLGDKHDLSTY